LVHDLDQILSDRLVELPVLGKRLADSAHDRVGQRAVQELRPCLREIARLSACLGKRKQRLEQVHLGILLAQIAPPRHSCRETHFIRSAVRLSGSTENSHPGPSSGGRQLRQVLWKANNAN
jgi:hypothetical protein